MSAVSTVVHDSLLLCDGRQWNVEQTVFSIINRHHSLYCCYCATTRMLKEVAFYKQEVSENERELDDMKGRTDKDEYDVKQFQHVLAESHMMVPDSQARLDQALRDLADFLHTHVDVVVDGGSEDVPKASEQGNNNTDDNDNKRIDAAGEWYQTARQLLKGISIPPNTHNDNDDDIIVETNVEDLADSEAF